MGTLHCKNMNEYGFSPTRMLPYKDRIHNFARIRENKGQRKTILSHIFFSVGKKRVKKSTSLVLFEFNDFNIFVQFQFILQQQQ